VIVPVPTAAQVRARLGLPLSAVPDLELQEVLEGEVDSQNIACQTTPYLADLREALYRRVARALSAKGLPLGVMSDEFGTTSLRATDAEIMRWEGPHMKFALGGTRA